MAIHPLLWLKRTSRRLPDPLYARSFELYTRTFHDEYPVRLRPHGNIWRLEQPGVDRQFLVPRPQYAHRMMGAPDRAKNRVVQRYTAPPDWQVEPGDVVVDVGAFIGEFTVGIEAVSKEVLAIEPNAEIAAICRNNTGPTVTVKDELLWSEEAELRFKLADDPTESSILEADSGPSTNITRLGRPLSDVLKAANIDTVDYLKLDAEGAEPEVLAGSDGIRIRRAAIDTTAERDGEPTTATVRSFFNRQGHETMVRNRIVFAREGKR